MLYYCRNSRYSKRCIGSKSRRKNILKIDCELSLTGCASLCRSVFRGLNDRDIQSGFFIISVFKRNKQACVVRVRRPVKANGYIRKLLHVILIILRCF